MLFLLLCLVKRPSASWYFKNVGKLALSSYLFCRNRQSIVRRKFCTLFSICPVFYFLFFLINLHGSCNLLQQCLEESSFSFRVEQFCCMHWWDNCCNGKNIGLQKCVLPNTTRSWRVIRSPFFRNTFWDISYEISLNKIFSTFFTCQREFHFLVIWRKFSIK